MTTTGSSATELRVGVRFERPAPAVQATLDRFVFALMQTKARAAPVRGAEQLGPGAERRRQPRVELGSAERLVATHVSERTRGVLGRPAGSGPEEAAQFRVRDISTTGCSFIAAESQCPTPKSVIRLKLQGMGLDLEISAKIIHARPEQG